LFFLEFIFDLKYENQQSKQNGYLNFERSKFNEVRKKTKGGGGRRISQELNLMK
jgi:hypothetical protein